MLLQPSRFVFSSAREGGEFGEGEGEPNASQPGTQGRSQRVRLLDAFSASSLYGYHPTSGLATGSQRLAVQVAFYASLSLLHLNSSSA